MRIGQAQDLPLQAWCRRASVGATLVVARCVENTAHGHLPRIITRRGDYQNLYKLILVSTGNISNDELIELFVNYEPEILDGLSEAHFVELTRAGVIVRW